MYESNLLTLRNLHRPVQEVTLFEEFGKATIRPWFHRGWSNEPFTILRELIVGWVFILVAILSTLFMDCEKLCSSLDTAIMDWSISWVSRGFRISPRSFSSAIRADSLDTVRQASLSASRSQSCNQCRLWALCLSKLWKLSRPHKSLLHLLSLFLPVIILPRLRIISILVWIIYAAAIDLLCPTLAPRTTQCSISLLDVVLESVLVLVFALILPSYHILIVLRCLDHLINLCEERGHGLRSIADTD